ncbi:MAG TPA: hypothetical protein VHU91_05495 [Mycobacteriales bacterium]|nr:hypothetical protein [Mycobacteriales bacterium]
MRSVLAAQLLAAVRAAADGLTPAHALGLVPIPTAPAARRRRGGDHLIPILRTARRRSRNLFGVWPLLRTTHERADSVGLDAAARRRNIADGFAIRAWARRPPELTALLLVDDVVTSGATLSEAARTLRAAGFPVLDSVALAATP